MKSIRRFLILVLIAVITLVVFVSTLRGYSKGLRQIEHLLDDQLEQKIDILHSALIPPITGMKDIYLPLENSTTSAMFQIWVNNGATLLRSNNSPSTPMTELEDGFSYINYAGYRWRARTERYHKIALSIDAWIMVAERDDARFDIADDIILAILGPISMGLIFVAVLVWVIVGFGLRPINVLANTLQKKQANDLSAIDLDILPAELQELGMSVNQLLGRLKASFDREKRFSADAAHELRNPITALSLHTQNLLVETPTPPHSLQQVVLGVERLRNVVEQILLLNKISPGQYTVDFHTIDLYELCRQLMVDLYASSSEKNLTVELEGNNCTVNGDRFGLMTLFKNLIDNAIKYTPNHGQLKIVVGKDSHIPTVTIMDSGPGIEEAEYQRIFNRFYRIGGDRHHSGAVGSGLGLSIVQQIAILHNASISFGKSHFDTGFAITVTFCEPVNTDFNDEA